MRVLVAHNRYKQAGGEDEVFRNETLLLRRAGITVHEYLEDNNRIDEMGPVAAGLSTVWNPSTRVRLRRELQQFRPDVVHFHNTFPLISPAGYAACADEKVPVVQTLHNYRLLCPASTLHRNGKVCEDCLVHTIKLSAIRHHCYRDSYLATSAVVAMLAAQSWLKTWHKQVDRFIALTEFSQTKFIGGGIPASKICVKPNFVWPDPGTRTGEREYALYVGRLAPEKGLQILLEAWERLPETVPLRIIGGGPLKDQLCADVRAAHRRNVSLVGSLPNADVISAMRQARFLVFPSIWFEGFPMTLLEAFACGLASITSRLGSMAEIVTDRKTGLHFEPGDSADLAGKVMWAWSHQEEMQQMGRAARVEYETRYTAEKNLALLLNIYRDAISGRCGVGNFIHDPERIEPSTVQGGDTSE